MPQGANEALVDGLRGRVARYSGKSLVDMTAVQMRVAEAGACIDTARRVMRDYCATAQAMAERDEVPDLLTKATWRRDGAFSAELCERAVDVLFKSGGGGALFDDHPLQRAFRDVHAVTAHISRILSMVWTTRIGARPTEGSSISRILGAVMSARARVSICCSPPLMLPASCARRSARMGKASKQNARFRAMASRAVRRYAPSKRFSSTVRRANKRRPSGTRAMPRSTMSSGAIPASSCSTPSITAVMRPALGRTMPMMHFINVLLPLPLAPSSVTVSPSLTESEMPSSTRTAP